MAKFTVFLTTYEDDIRDTCAELGASLRRLIEQVTGQRAPFLTLPQKGMDRGRMREIALEQIALRFSFAPSESRTPKQLRRGIEKKYGATVDKWIDDHLFEIGELKMAGEGM